MAYNNTGKILELLKANYRSSEIPKDTKEKIQLNFEGHMKDIDACVPMSADRTSFLFFHEKSKFVKLNELLVECQNLLKNQQFGENSLTYPDLLSKVATNENPFCFIKMKKNLKVIKDITSKLNRLFMKMSKYSEDLTKLEELLTGKEKSIQWKNCKTALNKENFNHILNDQGEQEEITYEKFMKLYANYKKPLPFLNGHKYMRDGINKINESWESKTCNGFKSKDEIERESTNKSSELSEQIKTLQTKIAEKDAIIAEKDAIIAEKDAIIAEKTQ